MNALIQFTRNAGPYLAIELLLPGGSVIALLLWLFRKRFKNAPGASGARGVGRYGWLQRFASPRRLGLLRSRAAGALEAPGSGGAVLP